jgi:hypothetical protein
MTTVGYGDMFPTSSTGVTTVGYGNMFPIPAPQV